LRPGGERLKAAFILPNNILLKTDEPPLDKLVRPVLS
jgi:hypothetical protein